MSTDTARPASVRAIAARPPSATATLEIALALLALTGVVLGQRGATPGPIWMTAALAASFSPLALFVLHRLPGHRVGRLMLLTGITATLATVGVCWSAWAPAAWASQWLWWPPIAAIPMLLLVFPDGALPSRRWRPLAAVLVLSAAGAAVSLALAALSAPRTLLTTVEEPLPATARLLVRVAFGCIAVLLLGTLAVLAAILGRWHRAAALERRQLICLLPSAALLVVGIGLDSLDVPGGWPIAVASLPLGLTIAILQFHLLNLDLYVHRGVVWLVLTAVAVGVYAVVVAGIGGLVASTSSRTTSLVAAAAAAGSLVPAERLLQRAVNRLLYGQRDDPYAVLTSVGRHIEAIRDPLEVLPRLTATLVKALRIPYAAIVLLPTVEDEEPLLVAHGRPAGEPRRFPMVAHGTEVGQLLVAARRAGAQFSSAEERLLRQLAGQAAVAAEACRSALELRRARERLVLAREEERRRLRRDLHDGVATALAGARFLAAAARGEVQDAGRAPRLLDTLAADLDMCSHEVRDLIDGLRPAALDRGLDIALRELTRRGAGDRLKVDLQIGTPLGDLPAAIEVVAYRVVSEALANVLKHANAASCRIRLDRNGGVLRVEVADDGTGLDTSSAAGDRDSRCGVGIGSIRSRVEEVGGQLRIDFAATGTTVSATLPAQSSMGGPATQM